MVTCPTCGEDEELSAEQLDDGRRQITCDSCGERWLRGEARVVYRSVHSLADTRAQFSIKTVISPETAARVAQLKAQYLEEHPTEDPRSEAFRARYKEAFSRDRLRHLTIEDIRYFANASIAGNPGNMSMFNLALRELGDQEGTRRVRDTIEYLLYGPVETWIEDRLTACILGERDVGVQGFREALLTKVLCMAEPARFLPIQKYTGFAGKREIASWVYGLDLPHPEATRWTIGRLVIWSNDLLVGAVGDGFRDTQHMARFLWWAKDESRRAGDPLTSDSSDSETH